MTHTQAMPAPSGLAAISVASSLSRFRRIAQRQARDMAVAAAIVIAATVALQAQDQLEAWTQDWVPTELAVPEDAELLTDRSIGSTVRLFSFSTSQDIDTLMADWEASLSEGGFNITQEAGELLDRSIEFSGTGISNAKIVAGPTDPEGRTVVEIDATLQ